MSDQTPPDDSCCLPGDVTVSEIHTGYLVGRALPRKGPGPWWEYIAILETYKEASALALKMAASTGHHVWFHVHGDTYRPLSDSEPPI